MTNKLILAAGLLFFLMMVSSASASSVSRVLPGSVIPGSQFKVQLQIDITDKETYFLIDEIYPFGFKLISADNGASLAQDGHIKWAVISGASSGIFSYTLQAPASEGSYDFSGEYIFENQKDPLKIAGAASIKVSKSFDCNDASVCKYGCDTLAKSVPMPCRIAPDTAPSPGTAEFDQTIWDMVKSMWDSSRVSNDAGLMALLDKMSQKGRMSIGGTEYQVGQNGTLFIKLLDSNELPINTGFCYITAYYPNKTLKFMDNSPATFLENGLYYKDFFVPSVQGLYIADASCAYNDNVYRYRLPSEDAGYDGAVIGGTSPNPLTFRDIDCVNFQTGGGGTYQNWTFNYTSIGLINISTVSAIDVNWVGQISAAGGAIQIYDWNASIWDTLGSTLSSTGITLACGNNVYITRSRVLNFSSYIMNDTIKTRLFRAGTASMITDSVEVVIHSNSSIVANLRGTSELHVSDYFNGTSNLTVNLNATQLSSILTAISSVNDTVISSNASIALLINALNQSQNNNYASLYNLTSNSTANITLLVNQLGINLTAYYGNLTALIIAHNISMSHMIDALNQSQNGNYASLTALINAHNLSMTELVLSINQSNAAYFNDIQGQLSNLSAYLVAHNTTMYNLLIAMNGSCYNNTQRVLDYIDQHNMSIVEILDSLNSTMYNSFTIIANELLNLSNSTINISLNMDDLYRRIRNVVYVQTEPSRLTAQQTIVTAGFFPSFPTALGQSLYITNATCLSNASLRQYYIEQVQITDTVGTDYLNTTRALDSKCDWGCDSLTNPPSCRSSPLSNAMYFFAFIIVMLFFAGLLYTRYHR